MQKLTQKQIFLVHLVMFALIYYIVSNCANGTPIAPKWTLALYVVLALSIAYHYKLAFKN